MAHVQYGIMSTCDGSLSMITMILLEVTDLVGSWKVYNKVNVHTVCISHTHTHTLQVYLPLSERYAELELTFT